MSALTVNPKVRIVGIRPGEKIHEVLCSREMSKYTLEFKKYYLIKPNINFFDGNINYLISKSGEKGKYVKDDLEYSSDSNKDFLKVKEIKQLIKS